jgi:hypothetical protein
MVTTLATSQNLFLKFLKPCPKLPNVFLPRVITLSTFVLILKLSKVSEISKKKKKKQRNTVKLLFSNQIIISAQKNCRSGTDYNRQ